MATDVLAAANTVDAVVELAPGAGFGVLVELAAGPRAPRGSTA